MSLLFVFDLDDTLFDYDWRERMAGVSRLTGLELDELRRRWWNPEGEWRAEAGGFASGEDYLTAVNRALGSEVSVDDWIAARRGAMAPRPQNLDTVRWASERGRVSVLTNNGPLIHEHLPELVPELVPLFGRKHLRASSSYGARKPDPAVYRALLSSYDADPSEVFFADDLPENIESAAALGITAHLYTDPDALERAVKEFASARVDG